MTKKLNKILTTCSVLPVITMAAATLLTAMPMQSVLAGDATTLNGDNWSGYTQYKTNNTSGASQVISRPGLKFVGSHELTTTRKGGCTLPEEFIHGRDSSNELWNDTIHRIKAKNGAELQPLRYYLVNTTHKYIVTVTSIGRTDNIVRKDHIAGAITVSPPTGGGDSGWNNPGSETSSAQVTAKHNDEHCDNKEGKDAICATPMRASCVAMVYEVTQPITNSGNQADVDPQDQ